jgi:hypothetical protein
VPAGWFVPERRTDPAHRAPGLGITEHAHDYNYQPAGVKPWPTFWRNSNGDLEHDIPCSFFFEDPLPIGHAHTHRSRPHTDDLHRSVRRREISNLMPSFNTSSVCRVSSGVRRRG